MGESGEPQDAINERDSQRGERQLGAKDSREHTDKVGDENKGEEGIGNLAVALHMTDTDTTIVT